MDDDIVELLDSFMKYRDTHDFAIFLQADHGMRYGNWFNEIEGYIENKLPACFLIFSTGILD